MNRLLLPPTNVTVRAYRKGQLVQVVRSRNAIVASGRNAIRDLLAGRGIAPTHIAIGTDSTVVSDTDTHLVAEIRRKAIDSWKLTTTSVNFRTIIIKSEFNGLSAFKELGLFCDRDYDGESDTVVNGGHMLARAVIGSVTKDDETELQIVWEVAANLIV